MVLNFVLVQKMGLYLEVKKMMFKKYPYLVNLYETPQNPKFEVFYLDHLSARMQFVNGEFKLFKA